MDSFEFEYGRVLENVEVQYSTYGTPKYDEEGFITNAILFFSTFQGVYSFLSGAHKYIVNNSELDNNDFFFIVITPLGSPNSCSPSTTGLNHNFPNYNYLDLVNFQRQFLAEKFKIRKILGLVGEGVGAFSVFTWACEYPDEMEFIFVVNSSAKLSGYKYILSKAFQAIFESIEDFDSEGYSVSKNNALVTTNTLIFAHSSSKMAFNNLANYEIDAILEDFTDEGLFLDVYDFYFRNEANIAYDVEDKLSNIKAKSLLVGTNDNYFNFEFDLLPLKDQIKDAIILKQEDNKKDYYFHEEDYAPIGKKVVKFLEQFKK